MENRMKFPKLAYAYLAAIFLFGLCLQAFAVLGKLAQRDFKLWDALIAQEQTNETMLRALVGILRAFNFEKLTWFSTLDYPLSGGLAHVRLYTGYAFMNILSLSALIFLRRPILRLLTRFWVWLQKQSRYERNLLVIFLSFFLFCYHTKMIAGMWYPGIAGWVYPGKPLRMKQKSIYAAEVKQEIPAFLQLGVIKEHLKYLPSPGYTHGVMQFMHFEGGEVLPFNNDIYSLIFYSTVVAKLQKRPERLKSVITRNLGLLERGGAFLMPRKLSYPNHAVYMPMDYRDYPPPEKLIGISYWNTEVYVPDPAAEEYEITYAKMDRRIDF